MKIKIKPLKEKDLYFLNIVRNSSREFLHDTREFSLEETEKWFKALPKEKKYYLIYAVEKGKTPGMGFGYFRVEKFSKTCWQVGADLHKVYRGFGYAEKAYKKLFKKFPKITCWTLEVLGTNIVAYTLYRKLGFEVNTDCKPTEVKRGRALIPSIMMDKIIK